MTPYFVDWDKFKQTKAKQSSSVDEYLFKHLENLSKT